MFQIGKSHLAVAGLLLLVLTGCSSTDSSGQLPEVSSKCGVKMTDPVVAQAAAALTNQPDQGWWQVVAGDYDPCAPISFAQVALPDQAQQHSRVLWFTNGKLAAISPTADQNQVISNDNGTYTLYANPVPWCKGGSGSAEISVGPQGRIAMNTFNHCDNPAVTPPASGQELSRPAQTNISVVDPLLYLKSNGKGEYSYDFSTSTGLSCRLSYRLWCQSTQPLVSATTNGNGELDPLGQNRPLTVISSPGLSIVPQLRPDIGLKNDEQFLVLPEGHTLITSEGYVCTATTTGLACSNGSAGFEVTGNTFQNWSPQPFANELT